MEAGVSGYVPITLPEVENPFWNRCVKIMMYVIGVTLAVCLTIYLYLEYTDPTASKDVMYARIIGGAYVGMIVLILVVVMYLKQRNFNICSRCPGFARRRLDSARNQDADRGVALADRKGRLERGEGDIAIQSTSQAIKGTIDTDLKDEKLKAVNISESNLPQDSKAEQSTSIEKERILDPSEVADDNRSVKFSEVASAVSSILTETFVQLQSQYLRTSESPTNCKETEVVSCAKEKDDSESELSSGELRRRKFLSPEQLPLSSSSEEESDKKDPICA